MDSPLKTELLPVEIARFGQAIFGARPTGDAHYWPAFAPNSAPAPTG